MKTKVIIILAVLLVNMANAQTEDNKENYFGLGIYASMENGIGFSARYDLSDKFSVQGTFMLPIFSAANNYTEYDDVTNTTKTIKKFTIFLNYTSVGGTAMYNIIKTKKLREFLYVSGAWHYLYNTPFDYAYNNTAVSYYDFGSGLGLEFIFGNIGINIQMGQALIISPKDNPRSTTSVGGGMFFYLK